MDELKQAREEIDAIDKQIVKLFEARMKSVSKVAAYKQKTGMKIFDSTREAIVIEKNSQLLEDEGLKGYYSDFMKGFMNVSKRYQTMILYGKKVGYQGIKGAFSHTVASRLFPNCELVAYDSFNDVLTAIENKEVEVGVLPYENSTTGEVSEMMDLMFKKNECFINGFYDLQVVQNLLVVPGTKLEDIKEVYSHVQGLEQSKEYLSGKGWMSIPYANTAMAARYVAETNDKSKAAIASVENADLYGLEVLAPHINSSDSNTTRFVMVTTNKQLSGDRFGLFFTVKNEAGYLARAVDIISKTGFNMTCLRSRSVKDLPWEYYFYAEMSGSLVDEKATAMLKQLEEVCETIRTVGCFSQIELNKE